MHGVQIRTNCRIKDRTKCKRKYHLPLLHGERETRVEAPVAESRLPPYSRDNPEVLQLSLHLPPCDCSLEMTASIAQSQRKEAQPGHWGPQQIPAGMLAVPLPAQGEIAGSGGHGLPTTTPHQPCKLWHQLPITFLFAEERQQWLP